MNYSEHALDRTNRLTTPLAGMPDAFGVEVRKRRYVQAVLSALAHRFGYEQIDIPLIERATSFSEEVVGRSPWPEWNERGCFYVEVPDYANSYNTKPETTSALLVPEGTVSVTRWLGSQLIADPGFVFPVKLFYVTPCFRNELVDQLSEGKRRQFTQFGLEVLGAEAGNADVEAIHLIAESLREFGVAADAIRVRVGDVTVFNRLVELSGLSAEGAISVKESLDGIAECKAGKDALRWPALIDDIARVLEKEETPRPWAAVWHELAAAGDSAAVVQRLDDPVATERLTELRELARVLAALGVRVDLDVCVVRSHEYYTGIAFEIDVISADRTHVEVGGGGRYDRLVGHFAPRGARHRIPSTGFAFGLERLIPVLESQGLLDPDRSCAPRGVSLCTASAERLLIGRPDPAGYLKVAGAAAPARAEGVRVDTYLGDPSPERWREYASARGIPHTEPLLDVEDPTGEDRCNPAPGHP
ncbi:histidyl-tRNA synthetase [Murinocardiopsis flavida]|uniref:Histidyl-tRNA synthetase n=1 Tax=Murinocardiopsis flavida TaxID=645275 RepID=A0A2P8DG39_9ACTN|nr:ATP phosphoribosyltransferase regulatory subunit [Murinocardiopsis flavida]PSK96183.1 histidyl-tRNA synthetase [Murinocardiopsis flavida]